MIWNHPIIITVVQNVDEQILWIIGWFRCDIFFIDSLGWNMTSWWFEFAEYTTLKWCFKGGNACVVTLKGDVCRGETNGTLFFLVPVLNLVFWCLKPLARHDRSLVDGRDTCHHMSSHTYGIIFTLYVYIISIYIYLFIYLLYLYIHIYSIQMLVCHPYI